jgi:hypothetical protein
MTFRRFAGRLIAAVLSVSCIGALLGAPLAAQAGDVRIPRQPGLTPAAEEVLAAFESQADAVLARSRERITALRARTVAQLQSQLAARMQAADLDGALAIRQMIRSLENTPAGLPTATGRRVLAAPRGMTAPTGGATTATAPRSYSYPTITYRPDPGDMTAYRTRLGERFYFLVKGMPQSVGGLWGTDLYTDDSALSRAAIHAGVLAEGETQVVVVTVLKAPQWFHGTSRHGVVSGDWNNADGYYSAFRVERAPPTATYVGEGTAINSLPALEATRAAPVRSDPGDMGTYYDKVGESFLFEVTGTDDGTVWGTDSYTYDSDLSTAAVHAGVVPRGGKGVVCAIIERGGEKFVGSTRNGVTTHDWNNSGGHYTAFRLVAMNQPAIGYGPPHANGSLWIDVNPQPMVPTWTNRGTTSAPLPAIPLPDPGNLLAYRGLNGREFHFRVTGRAPAEYAIWGTDVYTDDSYLAIAAVHAGALRVGETGLLKVTILPGQAAYPGSQRHGVRSESYPAFDGSYRIDRAKEVEAETLRLNSMDPLSNDQGAVTLSAGILSLADGSLSSNVAGTVSLNADIQPGVPHRWSAADAADGRVVTIEGDTDMQSAKPAPGGRYYLKIKGRTDGAVWGTDVYTSDSSLGTAAVHAGVLEPGQTGVVKVTILPGQTAYESVTRNGITSANYRSWDVSYRVEMDDRM